VKKILYIITKQDIGGAEKYVRDLARVLDPKQFVAKIIYGGIEVPSLSNRVWWWALFLNDWVAIFQLTKLFRRERPNIIHLNSSKAGVLGSLAAGLYNLFKPQHEKIKVVFTAHGWVFNPTNALSSPVRFFYRALHTLAAYFQNAIICVSRYDKELADRLHVAPSKKLVTIHNGIDYENLIFLDKVSAKKSILRMLGLENQGILEKLWIGSLGRLTKEKNYETLIKAATLVPDAYFFVIGNGPEKANLQLTTKNLQLGKRFFLVEPQGEDAKYLKAFDVFVMPSRKEGFPYALLEAMAARLPIIVTNIGGMSEAIENEKTGFVIEQNDSRACALRVERYLKNQELRETYGNAAETRAKEYFSLRNMVRETEALYEKITH
jgi:glycosyltransferase involved in cell wall biosynthesis